MLRPTRLLALGGIVLVGLLYWKPLHSYLRTKGELTVLGRPPGQLSAMGAANVGMLFQHGALFSAFSVLNNIAFPLRELKLLPDDLIRDAALVKLQMVGLSPQPNLLLRPNAAADRRSQGFELAWAAHVGCCIRKLTSRQ